MNDYRCELCNYVVELSKDHVERVFMRCPVCKVNTLFIRKYAPTPFIMRNGGTKTRRGKK
jgi:phage FluMu protein Com